MVASTWVVVVDKLKKKKKVESGGTSYEHQVWYLREKNSKFGAYSMD